MKFWIFRATDKYSVFIRLPVVNVPDGVGAVLTGIIFMGLNLFMFMLRVAVTSKYRN
jgi:hypothetical protein